MPIFEYKCSKCNKISEFLEKASAGGKKACPHCGGKLEKQISVFAPQIKAGQSKKCMGCTDGVCPHSQG